MSKFYYAIFFCLISFSNHSLGAERTFKLKDFSGAWVFYSSSVGGLGKEAGYGIASSIERVVKFDKNGNGSENNGTFVFYLPDGTLKEYYDVEGERVEIILTDPSNGAGVINFEDNSSFKGKTTYKFIASRSKSGAVNKLHIIMINATTNLHKVVVTGELIRQSEQ
jgi:hypothetical protein